MYLLAATVAAQLKAPEAAPTPSPKQVPLRPEPPRRPSEPPETPVSSLPVWITVSGTIPPEQWNRLGTRLLPKMRAAGEVSAAVRLEVEVDAGRATMLSTELHRVLDEIGLAGAVRIERG